MHRIVARLIPLALVILVAPETFAQGVTGSAVTGKGKNTTGDPLDGGALQLRTPANGDTFNAVSERGGKYTIDNVAPGGPYVLTGTAEGYEPAIIPDLVLNLGQRLPVEVTMRTQLVEEIAVVAHR